MDSTDRELVRRFREGDQDAATELYHRHIRQMLAMVRNRLSTLASRSSYDSEQIVQDGFRSFFSAANKPAFDPDKSNIGGLVCRIVFRRYLRAMRRRQPAIACDFDDVRAVLKSALICCGQTDMASEVVVRCHELADGLRPELTELEHRVLAFYLDPDDQRSLAQVAADCDCSLSIAMAVRERLEEELRRRSRYVRRSGGRKRRPLEID